MVGTKVKDIVPPSRELMKGGLPQRLERGTS
jgi:hypothetical protein